MTTTPVGTFSRPRVSLTLSDIVPDLVVHPRGFPAAISVGWAIYLVGAGDTPAEQMANLRDSLLKGAELLDQALRDGLA